MRADVETEFGGLRREDAPYFLSESLLVRVGLPINVHFGAFGCSLVAADSDTRMESCSPTNATTPTTVAGKHLQPQLAQVHPLDLLLHSFQPIRTVVLCQALHVVSERGVLVLGKNRVAVSVRTGEPIRWRAAFISIRVCR